MTRHLNLTWNPVTKEWFCARCGRTSDQETVHDAQVALAPYECTVPSVETPRAVPGTETIRLIRKPFKMTLRPDRSGSRFIVAQNDDGKPFIQLELFHDTVPGLRALSVGLELLSGTTPEQVKILVDAMNERIVGVVVTPRESGLK